MTTIIAPAELAERLETWVETQEILTVEAGTNTDGTFSMSAFWPEDDGLVTERLLPTLLQMFPKVHFKICAN